MKTDVRTARRAGDRSRHLWGAAPSDALLAYTVADDREWDARLLRWDILGSLGHAEGLRRSRIITPTTHLRMQRLLRSALRCSRGGPARRSGRSTRTCTPPSSSGSRDATGAPAGMLHTGRSRNDQVAVDLRLYLKDRVLSLHARATDLADVLARVRGGQPHGTVAGLYPPAPRDAVVGGALGRRLRRGIARHHRVASAALWPRLDRSPLGSAAGYGVPLPLDRKAAARALGFRDLDHNVAGVQNARGKLEAAVLHWCTELGHEMAKLSSDVILFSAEEFGWLRLPADLATGSSIMPQKRNPDLFELTRARSALVEGALFTVHALKAKLPGGYHRDFQFLKAPLMRGIELTDEMLAMLSVGGAAARGGPGPRSRGAHGRHPGHRRGAAAHARGPAVPRGVPGGEPGAQGGRANAGDRRSRAHWRRARSAGGAGQPRARTRTRPGGPGAALVARRAPPVR